MSKEKVITAIDVGSDKVATLIATVGSESQRLRVVGSAATPAKGVLKGAIVDLESILSCVEQSLNSAERMAGFSIHSAYVSITGEHVKSQNSTGVVAVANPDKEIMSSDIERVIEAARAVSLPSDQEILHVVPRYYKVDSQAGIRDPTHMAGVRLEAEAHIISGSSTNILNLKKCLNDLGIEVQGFVFSALAASEVVLSDTEKELGVVACDIGAGTTSYCAYVEGALEFSGSFPIGARHITQDVALGCRIDQDVAEKIKTYLCEEGLTQLKPLSGESKKEFSKRKKEADILDLNLLGITGVSEELSQSFIVKGVMYPRIEEIVYKLGEKLDRAGILNKVPAGIVYSGGGALSIDLIEISERVLGFPAKISKPQRIDGLIAEAQSPVYAVGVGLLSYGKRQGAGESISPSFNLSEIIKNLKLGEFGSKVLSLVKKLLP